ncbi:2-oxopent-4-enoate hydratase [Zhongshania marina]|uniref:2-oxopent-4-enoate hydratase n=1 Tax=Zhongshania marina TaxID=2304603 RepID=A0A2S4HKF7_9GAMM|nr:2-oxopent-4-enoate hydratase [Marortus luteolus]POP54477.1 2-oxopent-4-enoate hydratase [Marortus luteolus]
MSDFSVRTLGDELYEALVGRRTVAPLSERFPGLTIEDAYRIQERMLARRVDAGENIVGKKIGVTSKAIQDLVGIDQPDFGQLTSGMAYFDGEPVPLSGLIQPRAEAEVAFVLKKDLVGPGLTASDVIAAIDYACPCFEIVDSRITDWKIAIQDTIADNASCGVFLLGDVRAKVTDVDFNLAGMVVERNGELFSTAAGAAVQGGPVNAVVWLANTLGRLGIPFKAGEVILSGSQSTLVPAMVGDTLRCSVGGLGSCEIHFVD